MKARNENNQIKIYGSLPSKYKSETLNIAGGFDKLNKEIHEQEGFFDVATPAYDNLLQELGEIYFDEVAKVFTYPVVDLVFNLDNLLEQRLREFDQFQKEFRREITELYLEEIALGTLPDQVKGLIATLQQRKVEIIAELQGFRGTGNIERLTNYSFYTEETEQFKAALVALKQ